MICGFVPIHQTEPDTTKFVRVSTDFGKILPLIELIEICLRGRNGKSNPIITEREIIFNGDAECGHDNLYLGITWPSDTATSVNIDGEISKMERWFAGATLKYKEYDGDCSYETFRLVQKHDKRESWQMILGDTLTDTKKFNFTKTAYRPYDLAVTACLVIAKHHLGDDIIISSDEEMRDWNTAMILCQEILGYGSDFVPYRS